MKIMKPIHRTDVPTGDEWLFEVKYDGFRAVLSISADGKIQLQSRNNHDLTEKFPEIIGSCQEILPLLEGYLPLILDGELVVLNNKYQANFAELQVRGRMRNKERIKQAAALRPASFIVFDLLEANEKAYTSEKLSLRKQVIDEILGNVNHPCISQIESFDDLREIKKLVDNFKVEGLVAKRKTSPYSNGKSHQDWYKIKNWRRVFAFLTAYDKENGYFDVAVFDEEKIHSIGKCKHGINPETAATLKQFFIENGTKDGNLYRMPPAITVAIHTLDLYEGELREPEFAAVMTGMNPEECTIKKLQVDLAMLPETVTLTNTDKVLWHNPGFTKGDLLAYIREISPYMLPFLYERVLTVIRAPDGVEAEQFYQKHLPSYAPDFVTAIPDQDENLCSCDNLETLVWFANHGSIEYHVPFQRSGSVMPLEIVFDLDPPDREHFHLAIHAAQLIKVLLDGLALRSFVKTSGNKGLQVHIPIREGSMTYEETAIFTQAIAFTIENSHPEHFTTERMKKKRGNRMYIDYVQHGEGKTIIAPYSPRRTAEGTVAAPLFWNEVNEQLDPREFTIRNVVERVKKQGCPFATYFDWAGKQNMKKVLNLVRDGS